MGWIIERAREAFAQHRNFWDELNAATGDQVLLGSPFVQATLDHFGHGEVWLARNEALSAPAALLLVRQRRGFWCTFQPSQQPIGMVLMADPQRAVAQLDALVRRLPGGPTLMLGVTQQDPDFSRLPLRPAESHLERIEHIETGRVRLSGDFDAYWRDRPEDLRSGNARRLRRLAREGNAVELRVLTEPGQMAQGMATYSRLEQSGWKAAEGTSVGQADAQGRFYLDMTRRLAERGEAAIYELLFDGRPVASQVCIGRGPTWVSLKIAYDESFRRDAPGYLLQERIIRHLYERDGVEVLEFYGRATEGWTRKWTDDVRALSHLNVYRNTLVRSALRATQRVLAAMRGGRAAEPQPDVAPSAPAPAVLQSPIASAE